MLSALIVSSSPKTQAQLEQALLQHDLADIVSVSSCGEARRRILAREHFDLCVINAPLTDETGIELARRISLESITQVILLVAQQALEEISHRTEDAGVLTVAKPLSKDSFWQAMKIARAVFNKISKLQIENRKLLTTIDDIRIIDRAKCLLIETMGMTEADAHRYIEKQAMDLRLTKKAVALNVIKTYEN